MEKFRQTPGFQLEQKFRFFRWVTEQTNITKLTCDAINFLFVDMYVQYNNNNYIFYTKNIIATFDKQNIVFFLRQQRNE